MAVTVVKTPQGHKIIDQAIAAEITNSGGDALVTFPYHGLGTGDFVYITSDINEYNGFWYVTAINTNSFKISEYATADFVEYFQDLDIEYYQTQPHDWVSAYLPIVYKATNDRWPVNSIDTTRTVSSTSDDNGYTDMTLSGNLRTSFAALEWIEIVGAADSALNGIWQIVEVVSASRIIIDLPYDAGNSFAGATVQYYHNNYQVRVKIFAGLPGSHPWTAKKPFTEIAELSLTTDENNEVILSISDYIQGKIAVKNDTTLFSLPLNLDAFTGFYISTAESYDSADGYDIFTTESVFTQNGYNGYAVSGKLPFKNVYSGDYADYVYTDGSPAKWLTLMSSLIAVEDKYFDISFIKNFVGAFDVVIGKYIAEYKASEETVSYADQGIGVYRIPITPDADFDSFCVQIRPTSGGSPIVLPALTEWATRSTSGTLVDWTTGATPSVSLTGGLMAGENSELLWVSYPFEEGNEYTISMIVNLTSFSGPGITISIRNDSFVTQASANSNLLNSGNNTVSITFVATAESTRIALSAGVSAQTSSTFTLIETSGTETQADVALTEEICIDMVESCEVQGGVSPSADIRLLEDGSYRLLE